MSGYGPALPPGFKRSDEKESSSSDSESEQEDSYGPALPPGLGKKNNESESEEEAPLGPALPPHLRKKNEEEDEEEDEPILGPSLPPHLRNRREEEEDEDAVVAGPSKPPVEDDPSSDDDDDDVVGPLPPKPGQESKADVAREFEARARRMKDKIEGKDQQGEPKRESWMTELPAASTKNFGLGPRQFSRSTNSKAKQDRAWLDTPEMKAKRERGELQEEEQKEDDKDVLDYLASIKRDQEMEKISEELKQKRGSDSLMDMHSKKIRKKEKKEKKKREKEGKTKERRPFDRDLDLQANRFDNAQKELMLKKARLLDDRFSKGASKYL